MGAGPSLCVVYLKWESADQLSGQTIDCTPPKDGQRLFFSWEDQPVYYKFEDMIWSKYLYWIPLMPPSIPDNPAPSVKAARAPSAKAAPAPSAKAAPAPSAKAAPAATVEPPVPGPYVGSVKVIRSNGILIRQNVYVAFSFREHIDKDQNGWFPWNMGLTPMLVIILPIGAALDDAFPVPDGVWRKENRICCFWRPPEKERDIAFKLQETVEAETEAAQRANVRHWQTRIKQIPQGQAPDPPGQAPDPQGQAPDLQRKPLIPHPLWLLAAAVLGIILICVILIFVLGQAAAGLWVTTGLTLITVVVTFLPYVSRSKGYSSPPYSSY